MNYSKYPGKVYVNETRRSTPKKLAYLGAAEKAIRKQPTNITDIKPLNIISSMLNPP
ncbi:MAG: hypothetical protein HY756_00325 [Nitrospirae bacterium]|nr:hypothetical protein [Nitrospirota bacterium]